MSVLYSLFPLCRLIPKLWNGRVRGFLRQNRAGRAYRTDCAPLAAIVFALIVALPGVVEQQPADAQTVPEQKSEGRSIEKCEYPDALGNTLVATGNRAGEYRIALSIQNLRSADLVRRHLINATVLSRMSAAELVTETAGSCRAVITPSLFPDLRAFLIDSQSAASDDAGSSRCEVALVKLVQAMPTPAAASAAAAEEGRSKSSWMSNPTGTYAIADNILESALGKIYAPDSLMHVLVSIDATAYSSFDTEGFVKWLRTQQIDGGPAVSNIAVCGRDVDPNDPRVDHPSERLPVSDVTVPRVITLSTKSTGPISIPALRHVVIVGDRQVAANTPPTSSAISGYCNGAYAFGKVGTARIRCVEMLVNSIAPWTLLFCDPSDCSTEFMAAAVMAPVASEPAIVASGKENAVNGEPTGPYLIHTESSD